MEDRPIATTSPTQERQLRANVHGTLAQDTPDPDVAHTCARCGNVLAFASPAAPPTGDFVECGQCVELNVIGDGTGS